MLAQSSLDERFATDGVVIKDNAVAANIERQLPAALG
jgi:hypothetical protein